MIYDLHIRKFISKTPYHHSAASMPDLPTKRKRTINPRLLDDNNVSTDAIECRKVVASTSVTQPGQSSNDTTSSTRVAPSTSRQASVEAVDDDDARYCNAGDAPTDRL